MLEITVCVEVETDQDCDDFRIGHHALSEPFLSLRRRRKRLFSHLHLKFFAKIIGNTENFSNFTLGNHDTVFIVWYL